MSLLLGAVVIISYIVVIANALGTFPLAVASSSYFESPYWVGISPSSAKALTSLQALGALGYIAWLAWIGGAPVKQGILASNTTLFAILLMILLAAAAWPFATYRALQSPTALRAVLACVPLWITAIGTVLAIAGTFEANGPVYAQLGILAFGLVTILVDGIGWSAALIYRTVHNV